jgi:hypothetical protein
MASAISICSNALQLLGDDPIASFSENTKRAQLCANLWPDCRDALLRAHPWTCLRKSTVLAAEATAYSSDWGYSYVLPGDWLRTVQIGERGARDDFEQQGRRILADIGTLPLVYIAAITDPSQWDSQLVDAATAEMAARLAYPITQSASMAQVKRQEAEYKLRVAKAISGQDNPPEEWADSPFIDARY